MKTIYLCGGINKLSDAEAMDWREATKAALAGQFNFLDPMRNDYRGKEAESVYKIIQGDTEDIRHSDILIVNANKPSWGTAMELYLANRSCKTTIVVCADDRPSPWLIGHASYLVKTFEDAWRIVGEPK